MLKFITSIQSNYLCKKKKPRHVDLNTYPNEAHSQYYPVV